VGLINLIIIRENSRFFIPSSGMKTGANGMENRSNVVTKNVPYQILFSIPLFFSYNYFFTTTNDWNHKRRAEGVTLKI